MSSCSSPTAVIREPADLGVSERVEFAGGVAKADVPAALSRGDIFLNTTNVDNTPVSVLEAQAAGLAVVSTNVGGLPFLLEDGKNALLVPPDEVLPPPLLPPLDAIPPLPLPPLDVPPPLLLAFVPLDPDELLS